MNEVAIDVYTDTYKQPVCDLILSIQSKEFAIPITLAQQPDLNNIPKFYQTNSGNFWIAKDNDNVVGTIALLDIGNHQGALRKMFVAEAYRGKEIAKRLLTNLLAWAKQKAFSEIYLGTTEKFIRAQRFYEKNGFVEVNKRDLPPQFPIMDVDVKFYKLKIPAKWYFHD
jgi:N-acetylglutamate synthase-like GNAT family acetyltransferase